MKRGKVVILSFSETDPQQQGYIESRNAMMEGVIALSALTTSAQQFRDMFYGWNTLSASLERNRDRSYHFVNKKRFAHGIVCR